jgi:hypothetical protein
MDFATAIRWTAPERLARAPLIQGKWPSHFGPHGRIIGTIAPVKDGGTAPHRKSSHRGDER